MTKKKFFFLLCELLVMLIFLDSRLQVPIIIISIGNFNQFRIKPNITINLLIIQNHLKLQ
jgi:hypothetical protein